MKFILQILALIAAFLAGAIWENQAYAQTTYLYGAQGQSLGTVQQFGNTQYFYGAQGQSLGNAQQSGNTTYVYGGQGQSVGTVIAPVYQNMPTYTPNPNSMTPIYDSIFGR
jgi:YD repeat-containing protein